MRKRERASERGDGLSLSLLKERTYSSIQQRGEPMRRRKTYNHPRELSISGSVMLSQRSIICRLPSDDPDRGRFRSMQTSLRADSLEEKLCFWLQLQQRKYHLRLRSPLLQMWNCEDQAPLHKRYYRSSFETRMRPRPPKWLMPQAASPASRRRFFCSRSMLGRISLESKVFQQFSWNPPLINYSLLTTSFWVKEEYCCYSSHLTYNAKDVFQI